MGTPVAIQRQPTPVGAKTPFWGQSTVRVYGTILTVILVGAACWMSGALRTTYLRLLGCSIFVDSTTKTFGTINDADSASVRFRFTNRGSQPVRVVGCMVYCNCVVAGDLPFTLKPAETHDLDVTVRAPAGKLKSARTSINQPILLYTTSPAQPEIHLTVKGEFRRSAPARESGS